MVLYCIVLYCMVWYGMVWYSVVWYGMVLVLCVALRWGVKLCCLFQLYSK